MHAVVIMNLYDRLAMLTLSVYFYVNFQLVSLKQRGHHWSG